MPVIEVHNLTKAFRTYTDLFDTSAAGRVSGFKDNAGISVGARLARSQREALVLEGSFIGQTGYSIGLNITF